MIILLDSNVIIAAVAARGVCAEVLSLVIGNHDLIISEELWGEVSKSLTSKIKVPASHVRQLEALLREQGQWHIPAPVSTKACRDRSDLHILGLASAGQADFLVSGDKDLLVMSRYRSTKILTPREFWSRQRVA